jgi:hypothetical protein
MEALQHGVDEQRQLIVLGVGSFPRYDFSDVARSCVHNACCFHGLLPGGLEVLQVPALETMVCMSREVFVSITARMLEYSRHSVLSPRVSPLVVPN